MYGEDYVEVPPRYNSYYSDHKKSAEHRGRDDSYIRHLEDQLRSTRHHYPHEYSHEYPKVQMIEHARDDKRINKLEANTKNIMILLYIIIIIVTVVAVLGGVRIFQGILKTNP